MMKWLKAIWFAMTVERWYVILRAAEFGPLRQVDVVTERPGRWSYVDVLEGPIFTAEKAMERRKAWAENLGLE